MGKIKYLTTCAQLPASAPIGHPHLVDLESVETNFNSPQTGFGIADIVVTVLFNHKPKTLERFLDPTHDFKFQQRHKDQDIGDFCIIRGENVVTCGFLVQHPRRFWEYTSVYRMEDGADGHWTPLLSILHSGDREMTKEKVLEEGRISARMFIARRVWEEHDGLDIVVEDSAVL